MSFNFTRFPVTVTNKVEDIEYNLEIFGDLKLPWGMEFFIYRIKFARENEIGIGEVRLLPKEEFSRYFSEFTELPQSELH